jgi:hypothetical protein
MISQHLLWIFFPLAITLHNLEEAIWLPAWSQHAKRFHKPVGSNEFIFGAILVTLLAYLCTFLAMAFPSAWLWQRIFVGFLGAMILNSVFPHLLGTIILRKYCPGLLTSFFLLVPVNSLILHRALAVGEVNWTEIIASTGAVALVLVMLLPLFFKLGRKLTGELGSNS